MKGYLNATRLVTKLKMLRSGKKNKSFIIVEGATDLRLYSKFVSSKNCEVLIADSKENVRTCVASCNKEGIKGIVGIVDADFGHLDEKALQMENLFTTDEHDLECMLVHSPAYENILIEYADSNKCARFEGRHQACLLNVLLKNAALIGALRWYSLQNNLGLKFSSLDFKLFVEEQSLKINEEAFIKQVLLHSKKLNSLSVEEMMRDLNQMHFSEEQRWQLCCGHDVIELLTLGLVTIFGDYNAKTLFSGQLEGCFRLAYTAHYFEMTKLYRQLINWERMNAPYRLFEGESSVVNLELTV